MSQDDTHTTSDTERGGDRAKKGGARGRRNDGRQGGRPRTGARGTGGRPRDANRRNDGRHDGRGEQAPRLTIPASPEKILFKGIDCEVNGKKDLALTLYLHGAARLSGGCESNAERMLRDIGREGLPAIRERVQREHPTDVLVAFDYIRATIDGGCGLGCLPSQAEAGNPLAVYELIRLDRVEGDAPCIDVLASHADEDERMVRDGLKTLVRKRDSEKAASLLKSLDARAKERQRIGPAFSKAMRGDASARARLDELAGTFAEAGFLAGYIDAEDREAYIREGMDRFCPIIVSMSSEMGISGTPLGRFLAAKRAQGQGEDWIPQMIAAAVAGSDDAVAELMPVRNRKDVRKGLSSYYLAKGDAAGLVRCYDGEDASDLDAYCGLDAGRVVEVARIMGSERGTAWLVRGYSRGLTACRDELVAMARSGPGSKRLVYALHDVGADMEAARLYMSMYGDGSLPSVKWLSKLCADESVKEYLRARFEAIGETGTFESIFIDDGYNDRARRPKGGSGGGRGRGNQRRR